MPQTDKSEIPAEMERVRRRFDRWRKKRRGRAPIPERLWAAAAGMARKYGINPTSRALSLDFNKLKALVNQGNPTKRRISEPPQFLELVAPPREGMAECVIELEGRCGKMRIEWKGTTVPDLLGLSRMLWERR